MSWNDPESEDKGIYKVVMNHEEQYSIWPMEQKNPLGWKDVGCNGSRTECLSYIKKTWTDMRPLSLRKQMDRQAQNVSSTSMQTNTRREDQPKTIAPDDLVDRLSKKASTVEVGLRPEKSVQKLRECIGRGYLHIKFMETRGCTELGVRLDRDAIDLGNADFDRQEGKFHIEGNLVLNYVKVRCIADIHLNTLTGTGYIKLIPS